MGLPNINFSDEQLRLKETANKIGQKYLLPQASEHDKNHSFNEEAFQAACDAGLRTSQLADLVARVSPRGRQGIHPATRTFQALRIVVNRELDEIDALLHAAPALLGDGGVFAAISFHSLEDRMVKNAFRNEVRSETFEDIARKGIVAGAGEQRRNPRSRSARLRAIQKEGGAC